MSTLSLLTLNAALLQGTLFGLPLFSFSPYADLRRPHIVSEIAESGADVVCLQEISGTHTKKVIDGLKETYPYSIHEKTKKLFSSDLLILSKLPLTNASYIPFSKMTGLESLVMKKGILSADVLVQTQPITVVCTHLVAHGLPIDSNSKRARAVRSGEIAELNSFIQNRDSVIIMGDFNTSPEVSVDNYSELTKSGTDLFALDEQNNGKHSRRATWDDSNPLVSDSIDNDYPNERVDNILISPSLLLLVETYSINVMFNDVLFTIDKKQIPLSDHYGILANIVLR